MKLAAPGNRFVQEVLKQGEYNFLFHYPVVIDIGANIGTFSFWMYDHADTIYAVEPVQENVELIVETIRLNQLKKIIVKQLAISNQSIMKHLYRRGDPKDGGWRIDEAGDYPVDCRTLEDFMDSCEIKYADLVKLDVEGEELKILQTTNFPKDRIGTIIGEFHNGVKQEDLDKTLLWLGYSYRQFEGNHFLAKKL